MKHAIGFALVAIVGLSAVATPAFADDPYHFCHGYARTAVNQSLAARAVGSCRHLIWEEPARWTLDYHAHFGWCLSVFGSGLNLSENRNRINELNACEG